MCTGQLPFDADTPLAIAMKHTSEPLPRPTLINPNIPQEVGKVLIKALEKKPEDRYLSAIALSEAFERALELVYDPEARALKPGARKADDDTQDFVPGVDESADSTRVGEPVVLPTRKRRLTPVLIIGALALIPLLWLLSRIMSPDVSADDGTMVVTSSPTVNWEATVNALSTAVASAAGAGMSPEQVDAAIAATLQAMILEVGGPEELATILPTDELPLVATSLAETVIAQLTATHAVTHTPTSSPTAPTPSGTLAGSSETPASSATATAPLSPSATSTPTSTATPTRTTVPTATPSRTATQLPTNTSSPTVDICALISVGGFSANGSTARWTITNNSGGTITLDTMNLAWPPSNDAMFNVFLKGGMIWSGASTSPPTNISSWSGGSGARQVDTSANLEVFFGVAGSSGYSLNLTFSNGCQAATGN
jgi:serine/threonine protein kinase